MSLNISHIGLVLAESGRKSGGGRNMRTGSGGAVRLLQWSQVRQQHLFLVAVIREVDHGRYVAQL